MKTFLRLSVLIVFAQANSSFAIRDTGNGGNTTALTFIESARTAIQLVHSDTVTFPELRHVDLAALLQSASVMVTEEPLVITADNETQEVTAINYPERRQILLNRKKWEAVVSSALKQTLALHEILGLAGLERTGVYPYSQRFLDLKHPMPYQLFSCVSKAVLYGEHGALATDTTTASMGYKQSSEGDYELVTGDFAHELLGKNYLIHGRIGRYQVRDEPGEFIGVSYNAFHSQTNFASYNTGLPKEFQVTSQSNGDGDNYVVFTLSCREQLQH